MGAFDDLIPSATRPTGGGAFDDLIPRGAAPSKKPSAAAELARNSMPWLAEGVNTALGAPFSAFWPDGDTAQFFRENADYWRDKQTPELKARIAASNQRIAAADEAGILAQAGAAAGELWDDPVQAARLAVTNIPSFIPGLAVGRGTQLLARGAGAAGAGQAAAAVGGAAATNAVMNAGGARGEAFEDLQRTLVQRGMSPADATELALQGSILPAAVGGAAGLVSGGTGVEKALLGRVGAGAAARQAAKAFTAEMAGEQLEEVAPKVATNLAAQAADPTRRLGSDVGRTIVETAAGAGPTSTLAAGATGVRALRGEAAAPASTEPVPASDLLGPASGFQDTQPEFAETQPMMRDAAPAAPADAAPAPAPRETTPVAAAAQAALAQPNPITKLDRVHEIDRELSLEAANDPRVETLQAERAALTADAPKAAPGAVTSFSTELGARIDARYVLMSADDLITSHDTNLRPDARYPKEMQPRDRERAASEIQVQGIAQRLDPARLGLSADAATGAPIVGADGMVESGNGRVIALKRVYQAKGLKAEQYREWLRENAGQFGLTPEAVDAMGAPVLVRLRTTPVDRAEFARQANASTVAAMSPSEQAKADAQRVSSMDDLRPTDDGDFSGSREFIRRFLAKLPETERGGLVDAAGSLSSAGYTRVRNAVLAKAYGDSPVLTRMVESMDDNMRNLSRALMIAAPRVAQGRDAIAGGHRFDADITPHLIEAVEQMGRLKERGQSVHDALAQAGLLGEEFSDEVRALMQYLADNLRRPRRLADFIVAYFDALDALGDPGQGSLFGDAEPPTTQGLMTAARRAVQGEQDAGQEQRPEGGAAQDRAGPGREPGVPASDGAGDPAAADAGGAGATDAGAGRQDVAAGEPQEDAAAPVSTQAPAPVAGVTVAAAPGAKRRGETAADEGMPLQKALRMSYKEAVAANMRHMGSQVSEWSAVEVTGTEEVEAEGAARKMPTFNMPSGYTSAPTLFPSGSTTPNCELCSTPIKIAYWIKNDSRRWTMLVGSECVTHFGEGKSGEKLSKEAQQKIDRDLLAEAQQAKGALVKHYRERVSMGYGRYEYQFRSYGDSLKAGELYAKLRDLIGPRMNAYKVSASDYEASGDAAVTRWANKNRDDASELVRQARLLVEKKEGKAAAVSEMPAPPAAAPAPDPLLQPQTEADLRAKAEREDAARKADAAEQKRLADRARADAMREEFTLTGSDRAADVAAAAGQRGLFDEPQDRQGLRAEDRAARDLDAAAAELAAQIANDALDGDMDAKEVAPGLRLFAEGARVPADDLRQAVLKRLRSDDRLSKAQLGRIEAALDPTKPAAPAATRVRNQGAVENFGQALPPARRNMAAKLDESLTDDDIAKRPFSEIWPAAENAAIEDTFAAAVAHAARAEVPAKPRVPYKLKRWVESVKTVRELASMIVSGRTTKGQMAAMIVGPRATKSTLRDWWSKVLLLEQVPRDQWGRVGSVEERPDAMRFDDGKRVAAPMVRIEVDGRAHWLTGDDGAEGEARGTVAGNMTGIKSLLTAAEPEQRMKFEIRKNTRSGVVSVNKEGDPERRHLMEFATVEEARAAVERYDDLAAAWEAVKARDNITERDLRSAENRPRTGKDHRGGRDITPDDFQQQFGFRGGEFGKWVEQGKGDKERQALLNSAYDALMDLADIAGIPPRAISLNGTLGIAFGSRGSGWASAHFEPSNLVINLTKTRGAGALAHEWFHAMDNYFSRLRRGGEEAKFTGSQTDYRRDNYITHQPEALMVRKDRSRYWPPMTAGKLEAMRKAHPTAVQYEADKWERDPKSPEGVRPEVEQRFAALVAALDASPMTQRARLLDGSKSGGGYWSRTLERAARAFESYVIAKMHEQGYHNDFLVNVRKSEETGKAGDRYPYLLAGEVKPIAEAFDALFGEVKTRQDAAGNVALLSRLKRGSRVGMPLADLQSLANRIADRMPGLPPVRVLTSPADLGTEADSADAALRAELERRGAMGDVEGALHRGRIYLFAENLRNAERAEHVLAEHEAAHAGLRGLLGDRLERTMLSIFRGNPKVRTAVADMMESDPGLSVAEAVEEVLVDMPTRDLAKLRGWRYLVGQMSKWLAAHGFELTAAKLARWLKGTMSEQQQADLFAANLVRDARAFVGRGHGEGGKPMFSRAPAVESEAFRRWFGDSKVVDAQGKPLVVYHGTKKAGFAAFDPKLQNTSSGTGAPGFFFSNKLGAETYSGTRRDAVIDPEAFADGEREPGNYAVYLSLQNPLVIDMEGRGWNESPPEDSDFGGYEGVPEIAEYAQGADYDGVIVKNVVDEGPYGQGYGWGETTYIAFRPEQIKSAIGNRGTFDPDSADIRLSRSEPTQRGTREAAAAAAAEREETAAPRTAQDLLDAGGGAFNFNRLGQTRQDRVRAVLDGSRPFWLGALTRDQIADIYGNEIISVREYDNLTRAMENQRQSMAQDAEALYERWAKIPAAVNERLARVMLDATVAQVHPDRKTPPEIATSDQVREHARLRREYLQLPKEAQGMYAEVRDFHVATLNKLRQALEGRLERQIESASERAAVLTDIRMRFDQYLQGGPYFPLHRFGEFLVIGQRADGERVVAAYENAGEQQAAARELERDDFVVKLRMAKAYQRSLDGTAGTFIGDVLAAIEKADLTEASLNGSTADMKTQLLDDLNQLFIRAMPDLSYRKHFTHRKNVPGFSADVMRGFASSAFHAANHIARLNHADKMTFALGDAFKQVEMAPEGDFTQASQVLNELSARHEAMLNPHSHPLANLATQAGFVMYLGLSPAAGFINMLQVPMVALPYIGARHGFGPASAAMKKAYADIMSAPANRRSGFNAVESPKLSDAERAAMATLQNEGVIDLTQAHDLAAATQRDVGNQARSRASFAIARAMRIVGWTFHVPEVMNRQVTALMAYRLARRAGASSEAAIEQAREAIKRTQFDYSASNRARWMQGDVARVILQFKQFAQNMTYFLGRAAYQALKDEDPAVKRIARRQILATFAVTFAMAGSMGLPGIGMLGSLVGLLVGGMGDGDEPWDWKVEYRNALADAFGKDVAEVIAKGAPRALMPWWDISNRVSLSDLWWRDNGRHEKSPREAFASDAANALGPTAGTILGWYTASDHMTRGNYSKAVESIVPKFIRDPLKAYREGTEGVTSYTGEPLMKTTLTEDLGRVLGFAPSRVSEMYEGRAAVMNAKAAIEERRQVLLSQMVKARLDGDAEAATKIRASVTEFNKRHPEFAITGDAVLRGVQNKRRSRALTDDGVSVPRKQNSLRERGRFANVDE